MQTLGGVGHTFQNYMDKYSTVVWEKFGVKKFHRTPVTMKIEQMKIFLPQRNRAIYNGL